MKRIIRNRAGNYLRSDGTWTTDSDAAIHFQSIQEAISETKQHHYKDVVLVFMLNALPAPEYDVIVPLMK